MRDQLAAVTVRPSFDEEDGLDCANLAAQLRRIATRLESQSGQNPIPFRSSPDFRTRVQGAIRAHRARASLLGAQQLSDPSWGMMLDLFAARLEKETRCIKSVCIASGAPSTTALRYLTELCNLELVQRFPDISDGRRTLVTLTEKGTAKMTRYFTDHTF